MSESADASDRQLLLPPSSRRRRRVRNRDGSSGQRLLWFVSVAVARLADEVDAGAMNFSLPFAPANQKVTAMAVGAMGHILVGGCVASDEPTPTSSDDGAGAVAFVAKYTRAGDQLWRTLLPGAHRVRPDDCTRMFIDTDASENVFVAGTTTTSSPQSSDTDVFVTRVATNGEITWRKVLGTPWYDEATDVAVAPSGTMLFVTGFSEGDMSTGDVSSSLSNCARWHRPAVAGDRECLAGFVLRLDTAGGEVVWNHQVASTQRDRVFSVSVDTERSVAVVVGDTTGDLRRRSRDDSSSTTDVRHAGDLVVRRLEAATGELVWTTQLASIAADLCRLDGNSGGGCGIALAPGASEYLYLSGTTAGLLSIDPTERQHYATLCGTTADLTPHPLDCRSQLVYAKLRVTDGHVEWIRQVVSARSTSSTAGIALVVTTASLSASSPVGDADVAVAILAEVESLARTQQLLVLKATAASGDTAWTHDTSVGDENENYALGLAPSPSSLLVMGYGANPEDPTASLAYAHKLESSSGRRIPLCTDAISFLTNNQTSVQPVEKDRVVASLALGRSSVSEYCEQSTRESTSSVAYSVEPGLGVSAGVDFVATRGVVVFARGQTTAMISVTVLPAHSSATNATNATQREGKQRSFALVLESLSPESVVGLPSSVEIVIANVDRVARDQTQSIVTTAADGAFWRRLSRLSALVVGVGLALALLLGRACGIGGGCSFRRSKVFQYKRLRLRATSDVLRSLEGAQATTRQCPPAMSGGPLAAASASVSDPSERPVESEDDDELHAYLAEIQRLNDSLEELLEASASPTSAGVQRRTGAAVVTPMVALSRPPPTSALTHSKKRKKVRASVSVSDCLARACLRSIVSSSRRHSLLVRPWYRSCH